MSLGNTDNVFSKNEQAKYIRNVSAKINNFSSSVLKRNLIKSCQENVGSAQVSNKAVCDSSEPSQTKQLISKFDKVKEDTGNQYTQKQNQVKSSTKLLISQFDNKNENNCQKKQNEGKQLLFQPQFSNNSLPRPKINPVTPSRKGQQNTSKVHQMIYAMNKTGFLQDRLKTIKNED